MKQLTDVIVYDIFSPPVASRVYVYPSVAAYEIIALANPERHISMVGRLTDLTPIPLPKKTENVDYNLAAFHAFMTIGTELIFSEDKMMAFEQQTYESLQNDGLSSQKLDASKEYGEAVAAHILAWANTDLYKQTRTYPKYTVRSETAYWKPTPPDYMEGIEPHWDKIRTLVLDSAAQFPPVPPVPFDLNEGSEFYRQLLEVYEVGNTMSENQVDIAKFWDCNPYVSHHRGHAMFATKKITPGGHWMGITAIATRQAGSSFGETVYAHTRVSVALFDAFISCWDEKWRSVVVRPETLINELIDNKWVPLLQTPPFPEYTSGHSVISRAAAVTLTDIYGDGFAFADTSEVEFGLGTRNFESFIHASEEAAISRLYGGIHYMMAIDNGVDQGQKIGDFIVDKMKATEQQVAQKD